MVLRRGGDRLQRGWCSVFLVSLNVTQKPACFSWCCSKLHFYIEHPQPSCSFPLCSRGKHMFPWLQGEILSLAAPCSGEQQQKNLLCLCVLWCWHQSGSRTATGQSTVLEAAVASLPVHEPLGQPAVDVLSVIMQK